MTIIPCNENCVYQSDGYCKLESASIVTDCTVSGCMHKIEPHTTVIRQEPQRHLCYSGHLSAAFRCHREG